jgi:hypothetical protein
MRGILLAAGLAATAVRAQLDFGESLEGDKCSFQNFQQSAFVSSLSACSAELSSSHKRVFARALGAADETGGSDHGWRMGARAGVDEVETACCSTGCPDGAAPTQCDISCALVSSLTVAPLLLPSRAALCLTGGASLPSFLHAAGLRAVLDRVREPSIDGARRRPPPPAAERRG